MFSPDAAVPASVAARNPRRRQRTGSEDSIALKHSPKRIRRSKLTSETYRDPELPKLNGHVNQDKAPLTNGHAKEPGSQPYEDHDTKDLAIRHRGVRKVDRERRLSKHDGRVELARRPVMYYRLAIS